MSSCHLETSARPASAIPAPVTRPWQLASAQLITPHLAASLPNPQPHPRSPSSILVCGPTLSPHARPGSPHPELLHQWVQLPGADGPWMQPQALVSMLRSAGAPLREKVCVLPVTWHRWALFSALLQTQWWGGAPLQAPVGVLALVPPPHSPVSPAPVCRSPSFPPYAHPPQSQVRGKGDARAPHLHFKRTLL